MVTPSGAGYAAPIGLPLGLPLGLVERRVNALATAWLIYAGVVGLFGFLGLAFAHAFMSSHMGEFGHGFGHGFGHRVWNGPPMPFFFLRFAWVALMLRVGLAFAAGWGLLQKAPWGRTLAIAASCLALLSFPFGTALGIWSLAVLLNAPNALGYEVMAR
jgi:hypothetical protein